MGANDRVPPDLLSGTVDLLILKSLAGGQRHGYAIAQYIRAYSGDSSICFIAGAESGSSLKNSCFIATWRNRNSATRAFLRRKCGVRQTSKWATLPLLEKRPTTSGFPPQSKASCRTSTMRGAV